MLASIGGSEIHVKPGTEVYSNCVLVGEEASCSYSNAHGIPIGEATKFRILNNDNRAFSLWTNVDGGNIIMILDHKKHRYNMGMTSIGKKNFIIANKQCVGEIVRQE